MNQSQVSLDDLSADDKVGAMYFFAKMLRAERVLFECKDVVWVTRRLDSIPVRYSLKDIHPSVMVLALYVEETLRDSSKKFYVLDINDYSVNGVVNE